MSDREQMVQREKRESPLSDREIEEADKRSSTSAKVVHEAIRLVPIRVSVDSTRINPCE